MPVNLKIIILFQKGKTNPLKANATQVSPEKSVPACPPRLCIKKGNFQKQDFIVDNFLGVRDLGLRGWT